MSERMTDERLVELEAIIMTATSHADAWFSYGKADEYTEISVDGILKALRAERIKVDELEGRLEAVRNVPQVVRLIDVEQSDKMMFARNVLAAAGGQ